MLRPGYIFDKHQILVEKLNTILDEAVEEYDNDDGVVDDFEQYVRDWARRRAEEEYNVNKRSIR
jgi:hypothetical protein